MTDRPRGGAASSFEGQTPAALAIASHEAGHALQGRGASALRRALVFASRFAAIAGWMAIGSGFAVDVDTLAYNGAFLVTAAALAALALLPIGRVANRRALASGALGDVAADPGFVAALRAVSLVHVAAILPLGHRWAADTGPGAPTAVAPGAGRDSGA